MCALRFSFTGHGVDIFRDTNEPALRSSLVGVDAAVCVSEYAARDLARRFPDVPTVLIRNGVRVAARAAGPRRGGPIVVAARLVPKKGIDTLVRAVAALGDLPDLCVEIIGDGRRSAALRSLASELGVAAWVHFRGALPYEAVEEALGRASMLVLPCRVQADGDRDNLPTAIVEALAHAVPVISTPVAGISEVVVPGQTGLLVAIDDVSELAAAIRRLWSDHDFAVALGDRGRTLVAERFDPDRSTAQLRRVFEGR
jgi:glycosyltransferase involved in cell wall biosynthesis